MDGDMLLDAGFLREALAYLAAHPDAAGVTGHVQEMNDTSLEYIRRQRRVSPENRIGPIDRMNGGGLYRRAAIEQAGYFSDRNLHGYEEFDLGLRLRSLGWSLHRLDRRFVCHFGHAVNAYSLLVRRWRSKYLRGIGELLRASFGQPHWRQVLRELPELRLWLGIYAGLACLVAIPLLVGVWRGLAPRSRPRRCRGWSHEPAPAQPRPRRLCRRRVAVPRLRSPPRLLPATPGARAMDPEPGAARPA